MNRKLLLIYILFFISINAMAAFASIDCKAPSNGISTQNSTTPHFRCSNPVTEDAHLDTDNVRDNIFTNLKFNNREQSNSGALTFILLIPALLVFVFAGFEKSNK